MTLLALLLGTLSMDAQATTYTQLLGDSFDNLPNRVEVYDDGLFVAGTSNQHAFFSRLDLDGHLQWTIELPFNSTFSDFVRTPSGGFLLVGYTLPFDNTSSSIIAAITDGGVLAWQNTHDFSADREALSRIMRHPNAIDPNYPYYLVGQVIGTPGIGSSSDNVLLINIDEGGIANWIQEYDNQDDEVKNQILPLPSGEIALSGKYADSGAFIHLDGAGNVISAFEMDNTLWHYDAMVINKDEIIQVGRIIIGGNERSVVYKMDLQGNVLWSYQLPLLRRATQIIPAPNPDEFYVVAQNFDATTGVTDDNYILHFFDLGASAVMNQSRTIEDANDVERRNGKVAINNILFLYFVESIEDHPSGFGGRDLLVSRQQADFIGCLAELVSFELAPITIEVENETFAATDIQTMFFYDNIYSVLDWPTEELCSQCLFDNESPSIISGCDDITVALPSAPGTGCKMNIEIPTPSVMDNCSDYEDLIFTMYRSDVLDNSQPFQLGTTTVTWIIKDESGNQTSCTFTVTITDPHPPVIECPVDQFFTVSAGTSSLVVNDIEGIVSDNCLTSNSYTITGITSGVGLGINASGTAFNTGISEVYYTAYDNSGNISSCSFQVIIEEEGIEEANISCGMAVLTCFSGYDLAADQVIANGPVMGIYDVRNPEGFSPGNWHEPRINGIHIHHADAAHLGQVFGIALDDNGCIYVTSTTMYGTADQLNGFSFGPAGAAGIYRLCHNGTNWDIDPFVTTSATPGTVGTNMIHNTGSGLGNIAFDRVHQQFFVTNHQDGFIYRIDMAGIIQETYDYPGAGNIWSTPPSPHGFVPMGERLWGVGFHEQENRVYFSAWNETRSGSLSSSAVSNEIYSIGLDASGAFLPTTDQRLELQVPEFDTQVWSNPVSDIAFSDAGNMLLGEKVMFGDVTNASNPTGGYAHTARTLEVEGGSLSWGPVEVFQIGNLDLFTDNYANCAGGVDYGFSGWDAQTDELSGCDAMVWATGDALMDPSYNPSGEPDLVYGFTGMPASGNSPISTDPDFVKNNSYYVDLDGVDSYMKLQQGDIEVFDCVDCPPPTDTCLTVTEAIVECSPENDLEYNLQFKIRNTSLFEAWSVLLKDITPGFGFKQGSSSYPFDNVDLIPPVAQGAESGWLNATIVASSPVTAPTTICFSLNPSGISADSLYECCIGDTYCITLEPCCDPCEQAFVTVDTTMADSCCFSLDLHNECVLAEFNLVELKILTPGVEFGSHSIGGSTASEWFNPVVTSTELQWAHNSGTIPVGVFEDLINFCFSGIEDDTQTPQEVVINWYHIPPGTELPMLACSDTLTFECEPVPNDCVDLIEYEVECLDDGTFDFQFTIENRTSPLAHVADFLHINAISPTGVDVIPDGVIISTPINYGEQYSDNVTIVGASPGMTIGIAMRLEDFSQGDGWCCIDLDTFYIEIPECNPEVELTYEYSCIQFGNDIDITWMGGNSSDTYHISVYDATSGQAYLAPLASGVSNTGLYTWTPPVDLPMSTYYFVLEDDNGNQLSQGVTFTYGECFNELVQCDGDLIQNGHLNDLTAWDIVAGTPEHLNTDGHGKAGCIELEGNKEGGAIVQQTGILFEEGKTYRVSFSARYVEGQEYVRFWFRASNETQDEYNCNDCQVIGLTPQINHTNWDTYYLAEFTPTQDYSTLTIHAANGVAADANDATTYSTGRLDNICVTEIVEENCCIEPGMYEQLVYQSTYQDCFDLAVNAPQLEDCDEIIVNWGDGSDNSYGIGNQTLYHTYESAGIYNVCLYAYRLDNNGEICNVTEVCQLIEITLCEEEEVLQQMQLKLWPNPGAQDKLFVATDQTKGDNGQATIRITDQSGQLMLEQTVNRRDQSRSIDVAQLYPGMYFVEWREGGQLLAQETFIKL